VGITTLGLPGFHGCGYAAVDEELVIITADRIRKHNQSEHIYDIYYDKMFETDAIVPGKLRLSKVELCSFYWNVGKEF